MGNCWLCNHSFSKEVMPSSVSGGVKSSDFKISDSSYGRTARIVECSRCGFRYADPLPAEDLVGIYAGLHDAEYEEGAAGRIQPFRKILRSCLRLRPGIQTVLDIGAGTGLLCLSAGELGLTAVGVEPSGWAADVARTKHGVDVRQGAFPHPDLKGMRFDLIALVDVIEHVSNPVEMLREINCALTDDGLAVIVTPNVRSLAARLMGRRWWHYRLAHVGYFDHRTMRDALTMAGFGVVKMEAYSWTFPLGYIAERLGRYLPLGWAVRLVSRTRLGRKLFRVMVPVNLGDSDIYYAEKSK